MGGIKKAITDLQNAHVDLGNCITDHINDTDRLDAIEKRLDIIEGEAPEVCESMPIEIHITRGDSNYVNVVSGPDDAEEFCKAVLVDMRKIQEDKPEPCHRNLTRNCALRNIVNRMDCAICEEVAAKVLDNMRKER
jgi:hypothetical protein